MAAAHEWEPVWGLLGVDDGGGARVLLAARPIEVDAPEALPGEYALLEAPLADYDVVELTHFDRPVARGRIAFGDGFAVLGPVQAVGGGAVEPAHEAAVLGRLAADAFSEGAETMYAPVPADAVERYTALGFTRVEG